jgi:hypothetical protein
MNRGIQQVTFSHGGGYLCVVTGDNKFNVYRWYKRKDQDKTLAKEPIKIKVEGSMPCKPRSTLVDIFSEDNVLLAVNNSILVHIKAFRTESERFVDTTIFAVQLSGWLTTTNDLTRNIVTAGKFTHVRDKCILGLEVNLTILSNFFIEW